MKKTMGLTKVISTGKWGLNEKHFQYLINKGINMDFFLQIYNDFYLKKLIF